MSFIAIVTVIVSAFLTAYLIIRKEIRHCQTLDSAIRLITIIKNKALYYGSPFSDIISELQYNDDFKKFALVHKFCNSVSAGKTVPDSWKIAVEELLGDIETYECDILIRYGEEMCQCNKDEISELSENTVFELQEFRKKAIEKRNIRSKSTAAVTISSGIIIVLMFA